MRKVRTTILSPFVGGVASLVGKQVRVPAVVDGTGDVWMYVTETAYLPGGAIQVAIGRWVRDGSGHRAAIFEHPTAGLCCTIFLDNIASMVSSAVGTMGYSQHRIEQRRIHQHDIREPR